MSTALEQDRARHYQKIVGLAEPGVVLKTLTKDIGLRYYDIGGVLSHLKSTEAYKDTNVSYRTAERDHSKWKIWCENEADISYRTAQYWINIYEYFTEMEVDPETFADIGWNKLKIIAGATKDAGELQDLLNQARTLNVQQLTDYVRSFKDRIGPDNREVVVRRRFSFELDEAKAEAMQEILDLVMPTTDNIMSEAFFKIAVEWFRDNGTQAIAATDFMVEETVTTEAEEEVEV